MLDNQKGALVITNNGKVDGSFTDRDLAIWCIAPGREPSTTKVTDVCRHRATTITPEADVELMCDAGVRRLPVVESEGKIRVW